MNIIVSRYYEKNKSQINTTGDYNICEGLYSLSKKFENFKCISDIEFMKNELYIYSNAVKYFKSELTSITSIQVDTIGFLESYPNNVKQFKYLVDVHGWNVNNFTRCKLLLPYAYCYNIFDYNPCDKLYFFPHCTKYTINFNNSPVNKILLSGRGVKNPNRYPMRCFMFKVSLNDNRIDYLRPNHNYRENETNIEKFNCGKNYIKQLNKYKVCFADDSIDYSPYLVCKFFEILSSGALLLASLKYTKTYFENLGFVDGKHYISITENNYNDVINYVLDVKNEKTINQIRLAGYNFCNKYHNCHSRALQLRKIIAHKSNAKIYRDGIRNTEYYIINN